jgi:hypothetical protein
MSLIRKLTYPITADRQMGPPYSPTIGGALSIGLCFAQIYTAMHGRTIQGLVDGYKGTLASAITWQGPLMNCTGAASPVLSYGSNPQTQDLALGAFSIFARVKTDSTFNTTSGLCRRNDGNAVNQGWELSANSAGMNLTFVRSVSDFTAATSTAISASAWHTIGMSYPGDLTATSVRFYQDGVLQAHTTDNNGSGTQASDATQVFVVGESNFGAGAGTFKGVIDCLYIWKRALRHEEFLRLTATPYLPVTSYAIAFPSAAPIVLGTGVVPPAPPIGISVPPQWKLQQFTLKPRREGPAGGSR